MDIYENKYLKYKSKYEALKNELKGPLFGPPSPPSSPRASPRSSSSSFSLRASPARASPQPSPRASPRASPPPSPRASPQPLPRASPRASPPPSPRASSSFLPPSSPFKRRNKQSNEYSPKKHGRPTYSSPPRQMKALAALNAIPVYSSPPLNIIPRVQQFPIYSSPPKQKPISTISIQDIQTTKIPLSNADISEIFKLLNSTYLNNWILTGSYAIKMYISNFNLSHVLDVNDIDVLLLKNNDKLCNIDESSIGDYVRKQTSPQRSVTFINKYNKNKSFDVTCVSKISPTKINTLNGINILSPTELLEFYKDGDRAEDATKIKILKEIITLIK